MNLYTLQKIALTLSIVVVLNLLFNYTIFALYAYPQFDDFCGKETRQFYENKDSCEAIGGEWVAHNQGAFPRPVRIAPDTGEIIESKEYCDTTASCRGIYDEDRNFYNRNVFIMLISLGTLSFIAGFFFVSVSAVSSGLLFGGLLSMFIGNVRYWSDMNEYLRLIVLVVALASLIWMGYRKLSDK